MKRQHLRTLVIAAMLVAVEIVLNRFLSINTIFLKIGFSFVPIVIAAVLFGPWVAGTVYAVADFLGALLFPIGPYFPGFTACAFAMGVTYGLFLSHPDGKKIRFWTNCLPPVLINNLVFGLFVNTLWISLLYDSKTYWGYFVSRLPEYLLLIPVTLALLPALLRLCGILKKRFK